MYHPLCAQEGSFESAPQLVISTLFLFQSAVREQTSDISIVMVSSVFMSLYGIASRIAADDKPQFPEQKSKTSSPMRRTKEQDKPVRIPDELHIDAQRGEAVTDVVTDIVLSPLDALSQNANAVS